MVVDSTQIADKLTHIISFSIKCHMLFFFHLSKFTLEIIQEMLMNKVHNHTITIIFVMNCYSFTHNVHPVGSGPIHTPGIIPLCEKKVDHFVAFSNEHFLRIFFICFCCKTDGTKQELDPPPPLGHKGTF